MSPALWGSITALAWGSADFLARYTGGRLGIMTALAGMMGTSALLLIAYAAAIEMPVVLTGERWWALAGAGLGIVLATFLLYWGLVRGPISVVAPIVGGYPAVSLAIALFEGVRPGAGQWAAMAGVMLGVFLVARYGREASQSAPRQPGGLGLTILLALGSAVLFAVGIRSAQLAQGLYGELETLIVVRLVGVVGAILVLLAAPRHRQPVPLGWWPVLALQGLLDGGAYLALFAGSRGEGAAIAVVVASAFSVVPVILARLVLREAVTLPQTAGIAAVVGCVAYLSAG